MEHYNSELMWSKLSPRPIIFYLSKHDEYMVYWDGILLPLTYAQSLAAESIGIYQSPSVKAALANNYLRLYCSGAFLTQKYDRMLVNGPSSILNLLLSKHLDKCVELYGGREMMTWFDIADATKY